MLAAEGDPRLNAALIDALRGEAFFEIRELLGTYWHDKPTRAALETALRAIRKIPGVEQALEAKYGGKTAASEVEDETAA
jgi:hypothetical protein